jgi:hypothetical protein
MDLDWSVSDCDVDAFRALLIVKGEIRFVAGRVRDNVSGPVPVFSRDEFWRVVRRENRRGQSARRL